MIQTKGKIVEIKKETHDVKTFVLDLQDTIDFIPGHHCMISIVSNTQFKNEWRPFSFANSPSGKRIELTVKQTGSFTQALHGLMAGDTLRVRGPLGKALTFDDSVKEDVVFLAGGSGITPFMSAIRFAVSKNLPNKIILIFSNKTVEDIIYRDELQALSKRENISIINTLTMDVPKGWQEAHGRFNKDMLIKYVDRPREKLWYVCGPPPMVAHLKNILREIGVSKERLRVEEWNIPAKKY